MFKYNEASFKQKLRRYLTLLQVPDAQQFGLRCFRAGKATSLASAGHAFSKIMAAGEWRSRAALLYVDDDVVDAGQALTMAIDGSGESEPDDACGN